MEISNQNFSEGENQFTPNENKLYVEVVEAVKSLQEMEDSLDKIAGEVFDLNKKINGLKDAIEDWRESNLPEEKDLSELTGGKIEDLKKLQGKLRNAINQESMKSAMMEKVANTIDEIKNDIQLYLQEQVRNIAEGEQN